MDKLLEHFKNRVHKWPIKTHSIPGKYKLKSPGNTTTIPPEW